MISFGDAMQWKSFLSFPPWLTSSWMMKRISGLSNDNDFFSIQRKCHSQKVVSSELLVFSSSFFSGVIQIENFFVKIKKSIRNAQVCSYSIASPRVLCIYAEWIFDSYIEIGNPVTLRTSPRLVISLIRSIEDVSQFLRAKQWIE